MGTSHLLFCSQLGYGRLHRNVLEILVVFLTWWHAADLMWGQHWQRYTPSLHCCYLPPMLYSNYHQSLCLAHNDAGQESCHPYIILQAITRKTTTSTCICYYEKIIYSSRVVLMLRQMELDSHASLPSVHSELSELRIHYEISHAMGRLWACCFITNHGANKCKMERATQRQLDICVTNW